MAQQPPDVPGAPPPENYRELYAAVGYQAGEPAPGRLVASYRFAETPGGGERPTPASLKEQTYALSERRPIAFLCLLKRPDASVEVRILHRMMRSFELPSEGGGARMLIDLLSMALLGEVRAAQMPVVEVDNSHFSLIGAGVLVPTAAVMPEQLMAAPPWIHLGPSAPTTLRPR